MAINPDAEKVVELIKASGRPPYPTVGHIEARRLYMASREILQHAPAAVAEVKDLVMKGPAGDIPLRLYRGSALQPGKPQPVLVYYHGGGWVIGGLDSHDGVCRDLANGANCTVISVDYRMGPEHKFPAAVDDSIAALEWIAANAKDLGIDPGRLAVGGDSAGGNLSAVVSIHARDNGGPKIAFQMLVYPACDMTTDKGSIVEFAEQLPLTRATMDWFMDLYLADKKDAEDWRASPAKAKSLKGLPPAYVMTAGMDPLRDEGEAYAKALAAAGVPVEAKRFDGQIHGFITMGKFVQDAHVAAREMSRVLKAAFA